MSDQTTARGIANSDLRGTARERRIVELTEENEILKFREVASRNQENVIEQALFEKLLEAEAAREALRTDLHALLIVVDGVLSAYQYQDDEAVAAALADLKLARTLLSPVPSSPRE